MAVNSKLVFRQLVHNVQDLGLTGQYKWHILHGYALLCWRCCWVFVSFQLLQKKICRMQLAHLAQVDWLVQPDPAHFCIFAGCAVDRASSNQSWPILPFKDGWLNTQGQVLIQASKWTFPSAFVFPRVVVDKQLQIIKHNFFCLIFCVLLCHMSWRCRR